MLVVDSLDEETPLHAGWKGNSILTICNKPEEASTSLARVVVYTISFHANNFSRDTASKRRTFEDVPLADNRTMDV